MVGCLSLWCGSIGRGLVIDLMVDCMVEWMVGWLI